MTYGGIDEVEFDYEEGWFYIHRDTGAIQQYSIAGEPAFLNWIERHEEDIDLVELVRNEESDEFQDWKWNNEL